MKKIKVNKKTKFILLIVIIVVVIIIGGFLISKKLIDKNGDSNLSLTKSAIEHVFYYLPENEYDNMNNISDYCKLVLVFDTEFLQSDKVIYDHNGKKNDAYSINNVLSAIRKVLGSSANINFSADETGDYGFIVPDACQLGNIEAANLSFDSGNGLIYSLEKIESNRDIYINWNDELVDGKDVTLYAQALMSIKVSNGYDLYVDANMTNFIGHYDSLGELKKSLNENYALSYNYEFHLEKNDKNYIWKSFTKNIIDEIVIS